jgi:hypothetical protein
MTNKQLYNIIFENFIQAKRELIREGYLKKEESNKIDFNEIFDKTKGEMQKKKIEKLQRENQMLREKLSQKQLKKEAVVGPQGGMGSGGSRLIDKPLRKLGKFFGNPTDKLTDVAMQLNKNSDDYRILLSYISNGTLNNDAKIAKAITFIDALDRKGISGSNFESALDRGIEAISSGEQPEGGIFENRKRRSLKEEATTSWSKMMRGVNNGGSGPWSIVVTDYNKVVDQDINIKIKDSLPAHYEEMKRKYPNKNIYIEDNGGQVVWSNKK